jgi:3-oxocholest-4-en-26-oate---CoA ligase
MLSTEVIDGLLDFTPGALVVDALGSTEGAMAQKLSVKGAIGTTASFAAMPSTKVFGPDDREVVPGSGEIGIVAVTGSSIPLGYYKDEAKTARTFRVIDGVRYSLPGDMARVELDGSITLLGRGSNCINTAGEKVYPEEVEEIVKTHPAVADCLVFGVDDERFGQRIIGVFSAISGTEAPSGDEVIAHAKAKLAGYKVPKQLVAVDVVPRSPNGKADYGAARDLVIG